MVCFTIHQFCAAKTSCWQCSWGLLLNVCRLTLRNKTTAQWEQELLLHRAARFRDGTANMMYSLIFCETMIRLTENPLTNPAAWQCGRSIFVCNKYQSACRICKEHFLTTTQKKKHLPHKLRTSHFRQNHFFDKFPPTPHRQPGGAPRKGRHQFSFIVALLVIMCFTAEETSAVGNKRRLTGVLPPPNFIGWPHQTTAAVSMKKKKAWCPTWWEIVDTLFYFTVTDARFILLKRGKCQRISTMRSIINEPNAALARWLRQMGTLSGR